MELISVFSLIFTPLAETKAFSFTINLILSISPAVVVFVDSKSSFFTVSSETRLLVVSEELSDSFMIELFSAL